MACGGDVTVELDDCVRRITEALKKPDWKRTPW